MGRLEGYSALLRVQVSWMMSHGPVWIYRTRTSSILTASYFYRASRKLKKQTKKCQISAKPKSDKGINLKQFETPVKTDTRNLGLKHIYNRNCAPHGYTRAWHERKIQWKERKAKSSQQAFLIPNSPNPNLTRPTLTPHQTKRSSARRSMRSDGSLGREQLDVRSTSCLQVRKAFVRTLCLDDDCALPCRIDRFVCAVRTWSRNRCTSPNTESGTVDPVDDRVLAALWSESPV